MRGESASGYLSDKEGREPGELDALYRRFARELRRVITRRFGPGPPDPDDAVQAAFAQYAGLDDTSHIGNPEAFLTRTARNFVIDQRRRQAMRARHADVAGEEIADDPDAARVVEAKGRWEIVEATLQKMDERRREALIMNRVHGLSCAEIARRRGCSVSLVKLHIAEAVVLCQRALRRAEIGL